MKKHAIIIVLQIAWAKLVSLKKPSTQCAINPIEKKLTIPVKII